MSSSMISMDINESGTSEESSRFKENRETFEALQGLVCKIQHGIKYGQRIVQIYRISLFLNKTFNELMQIKDSLEFLELAVAHDCENKLLILSDIIDAMEMTNIEITEFIAKEITACIIRTRFLQFNKDTDMNTSSASHQSFDDIWGFCLSKDLHLILELCRNHSTLLGYYLLKFYEILSQQHADIPIHSHDAELNKLCQLLNRSITPQIMSLKKQNIIRVELLITAHDCFCQECSTEGIGKILNLSKTLVSALAEKRSFNLIVKLLCGIGRYREMFYCFDILIKNEAFEALLGQFNDKESSGIKTAILSYLNENHPNNKEYYRMAASHFLMHTEMAKIWKASATERIQKILNENQVKVTKSARIFSNILQQVEIPYLKCSKAIIATLHEALTEMVHATEMVSIDNKIEMFLKFSSFCELLAMQIHLVTKVGLETEEKLCPCVINQEQSIEKYQYFANYELSVPQILILNKNIEVKTDFAKAVFCRLMIVKDEAFFVDFVSRIEMSDAMIENVVKLTQLETISKKQEKILHDLVLMVSGCGLKFKLASLLGLKGLLQQLINDEQSYHYLLDTKYGSVDIF
jgi:spatacsin